MAPFVNRAGALASLSEHAAFLDEGHGSTVLVQGEAGMGTSALVAHWLGARTDLQVLTVRGVEREADLPFAGLAALVQPVLGLIDDLPEPQPASLRAALALGPAAGGDRFTAFVAVVGLLASAARRSPLLVAVDDAHHLDPSTAAALAFASRRLADDPVLVVLAGRPEAFAGGAFDHGTTIDRLSLGYDDARRVLDASATVPIHPAVAARLLPVAQGNPAALVALGSMLDPDELRGRRPLPEPLPVGAAFEAAVARRIADLPHPTTQALLLLAAGAADGDHEVRRALTATGVGGEVLAPAEREGIVELVDGRYRFRDARLRSAIYRTSAAPDRRNAHEALAAAHEPGSLARALHTASASTGPDEEVASALEAAAIDAGRRGDAAASWRTWERASELSTTETERARRLIGAAGAALELGSPDAAQRLLADVEPHLVEDLRPSRDLVQGRLLVVSGRPDAAVEVLTTRADELAGPDPAGAAALLLDAVPAMLRSGRIGTATTLARRSSELARAGGDDRLEARSAVALGAALAAAGDPSGGRDLLDRFPAVLDREGEVASAPFLADTAALALVRLGDHGEAGALLDRLARAVGDASAPHAAPGILSVQGFLAYRAGRLAEAAAASSAAVQIADETGQPGLVPFPLGTLATVEGMRGDEASCRAAAARLSGLGLLPEGRGHDVVARAALGLLELGLGRPDDAVAVLAPLRATLDRSRPSVLMWEADLADALIRTGRSDDAGPVIASLEAAAEGADDDRARAAVARLRALLAPDDDREPLSEHAVAAFRELGLTFGLARSLLDLGAWLRRSRRRRAARAPLQEALERFEAMSSTSWSSLAAAELERCGGPDRDRTGGGVLLTPQEQQVAALFADGASNREAAARLFVSVRTIESHLSRIYRKLGLRSRSELTRWVGQSLREV